MSIDTIFKYINNKYVSDIDWTKSNPEKNVFYVRTNITDISFANNWLELFSTVSNSNWIVNFELQNPQK
jgi:hypothetical protein